MQRWGDAKDCIPTDVPFVCLPRTTLFDRFSNRSWSKQKINSGSSIVSIFQFWGALTRKLLLIFLVIWVPRPLVRSEWFDWIPSSGSSGHLPIHCTPGPGHSGCYSYLFYRMPCLVGARNRSTRRQPAVPRCQLKSKPTIFSFKNSRLILSDSIDRGDYRCCVEISKFVYQ